WRPPPPEPIAQGLASSRGAPRSPLFRPLRLVCPIGWIGGGYGTSKPSSAKRGRSSRMPANPPQERGKSSYHEPKRPRTRSTSTGYVADHAFSERAPPGAASAVSTVSWSSSRRTAPSDNSPARSAWLAATLRRSSSWNDATRSTHASIPKLHAPGASTSNHPLQRQLP